MVDILHRVGIADPARSVCESFTTIGLTAGFEGGKATPFPDDEPISSYG